MPSSLHDELAQAAAREGVSLNQLITGVLAGAVEWGADDERVRLRTEPTAAADASRATRIVLIANLVVVLVAATAAITLLVVAWQDGF